MLDFTYTVIYWAVFIEGGEGAWGRWLILGWGWGVLQKIVS